MSGKISIKTRPVTASPAPADVVFNINVDPQLAPVRVLRPAHSVPVIEDRQIQPKPAVKAKTESEVKVKKTDPLPGSDGADEDMGEVMDEELDGDPEIDEDGEPTEQKAKTRKARTKKTYPPSEKMFEELIELMCDMRDTTRKIVSLLRETQKCVVREQKDFKLQTKKAKADKPVAKPRGFAVPSPISQEMVQYLINEAKITSIERKIGDTSMGQIRIESGCSLARNELTAALCQHFKNSGMRKSSNDKRDIYLDKATSKLFAIDASKFAQEGGRLSESGEPIITYFDLQKYLPRHCGKNAKK